MKKQKAVTGEEPKRRKPDFSGVPGELVSIVGMDLHFGNKLRGSPYDALLDKLAAAPAGQALKFGDVKARVSVNVRARKKGLRVSCAEKDGVLYVRLDGHVDDDKRARRREAIRGALKFGAMTEGKLANLLRTKGDTTIDVQLVTVILAQMQRTGEVIQREGGEWGLNPTGRKGQAA